MDTYKLQLTGFSEDKLETLKRFIEEQFYLSPEAIDVLLTRLPVTLRQGEADEEIAMLHELAAELEQHGATTLISSADEPAAAKDKTAPSAPEKDESDGWGELSFEEPLQQETGAGAQAEQLPPAKDSPFQFSEETVEPIKDEHEESGELAFDFETGESPAPKPEKPSLKQKSKKSTGGGLSFSEEEEETIAATIAECADHDDDEPSAQPEAQPSVLEFAVEEPSDDTPATGESAPAIETEEKNKEDVNEEIAEEISALDSAFEANDDREDEEPQETTAASASHEEVPLQFETTEEKEPPYVLIGAGSGILLLLLVGFFMFGGKGQVTPNQEQLRKMAMATLEQQKEKEERKRQTELERLRMIEERSKATWVGGAESEEAKVTTTLELKSYVPTALSFEVSTPKAPALTPKEIVDGVPPHPWIEKAEFEISNKEFNPVDELDSATRFKGTTDGRVYIRADDQTRRQVGYLEVTLEIDAEDKLATGEWTLASSEAVLTLEKEDFIQHSDAGYSFLLRGDLSAGENKQVVTDPAKDALSEGEQDGG